MSAQKYLTYLLKDEIMYELKLLGIPTDENVTAEVLRKQIRQVYKLARRGSMKCEPLQPPNAASEIEICSPKVALLESQLQSGNVSDRNLVLRISGRANYLIDRLARVVESDTQLSDLRSRLIRVLGTVDRESSDSDSEYVEPQAQSTCHKSESRVVYVKDKPTNLNSLNLKFDGTTCVRVFIERLQELRQARNIPENQLFTAFSDLLEGSVLNWFRNNKDNFNDFPQLLKCLREDFDIPDLDYKLRNEINQRTQSRTETIVNYLSTMQGMFARLTRPLSGSEQLEILMHNIRPEYMNSVALQNITSIDELKSCCKQLELAQSRADNFREPNFNNFKVTSDMHKNMTSRCFQKQVSALSVPQTSQNLVKSCFRCGKNTHFTNQCKSKEVVCFKCGTKGVKRTDCGNCLNSKN